MGLAISGLAHDFGFLGTDGTDDSWKPVSTSLHCLLTGRIEATVIDEKKIIILAVSSTFVTASSRR